MYFISLFAVCKVQKLDQLNKYKSAKSLDHLSGVSQVDLLVTDGFLEMKRNVVLY